MVAQAIDIFFQSANQRSIQEKKLTPMEWHFLQDFEVILEVRINVFEMYVAINCVMSASTQSSAIYVQREHPHVGQNGSNF
jgi:hypothetical protein